MVAFRLGASTMPIFSHFSTMEKFGEAIRDQAWETLKDYASRTYTGDAWVVQRVGWIRYLRALLSHGIAVT